MRESVVVSPYTIPLDSPGCTPSSGGAKAANLSQLARAGFPVPPGFVITTPAYCAFVKANGIDAQIQDLVRSTRVDDPEALESASQAVRQLFEKGSLPQAIEQEILGAYRHLALHATGVAVRSSATAEDLPNASFAGQQETYLNVCGEHALIHAIRRCWSSLWTARAWAYRARHTIDPFGVSLAVIVQAMAPALSSGVLFTINPLNSNSDEMLLNAAWGLGESVVGGLVTPDMFVVDKASGRVIQAVIADKKVMTVISPSGTAQTPVPIGRQREASLRADQLATLIRLGREIEASFGAPQDIEWAVTGDRTYILQSRPVTRPSIPVAAPIKTPPDAPPPCDDNWPITYSGKVQDFDRWTRANVGELWSDPVSPLVASVIPEIIAGALRYTLRGIDAPELLEARWAGRFYGRMYYNEGALRRIFWKELGLPASFVDRGRGNRESRRDNSEDKFRPWKLIRRLPVLARLATRQWVTGKELDVFIPQVDRWVAEFNARNYAEWDDRTLWNEALVWLERIKLGLKLQNELSGYSLTAVATLERLTERWFHRRDLIQVLISGIPGIQAAEMGAALFRVARALRDAGLEDIVRDNDPKTALQRLRQLPEAAAAMRLLDVFLQEHGHRCPNEAEWLHPRWAEAPEQLIELLVAYLRHNDAADPNEAHDRQQRRRAEAVAWVEAHLGPLRRAVFRAVLARAHHAARLRDNGKSSAIKATFPARRICALWGERWAKRGWLEQPEDIFYLTLPDIRQVIEGQNPASLDLKHLVAARRKAYAHWFLVEAPEIVGADGQRVLAKAESESSAVVLRGISASGGHVRGRARIIIDSHEALTMHPGEILVARATDAGWTSVFPLLGGLVTEIGGQLSHAAILAREYGLPAVVDVRNATRVIRDGQMVTVDGTTAEVHLENGNREVS